MKSRETDHPDRSASCNGRKRNSAATCFGVAFMLAALAAQGSLAQTLAPISRSNDWTTVRSENGHGTAAFPNALVWRYWWQSGRDPDGGPVPGSLRMIEPARWQPLYSIATAYRLRWIDDQGVQQPEAGEVIAYPAYISAYWNVLPTSPSVDWKPSWLLAAYEEQKPYGVYDITGKLDWMPRSQLSGWYRLGCIAVVRSADDSVEVLWSQALTAPVLDQRATLFDDNAAGGSTIPAALKQIGLLQGDRLVVGVRGSSDQYRTVRLYDDAMRLQPRAPAYTDNARNRSRCLSFTNSTVHQANYHGSTLNPTGNVWSYWWQPGKTTVGTNTALAAIDSALWVPMNRSGAASYKLAWLDENGAEYAGGGNIAATSRTLFAYWNDTPVPAIEWCPSWALAVYTEQAEQETYRIGGRLAWMATHWAEGTRRATLTIIRANGTLEPLYETNLNTTALDVEQTIFAENDESAPPVPLALRHFTLQRGDRLVVGMRGGEVKFRGSTLIDEHLTLSVFVPTGTVLVLR